MTSYPANVRGAPVNILGFVNIKNVLVSKAGLSEVSASGVKNSFWLSCCSRGVKNK